MNILLDGLPDHVDVAGRYVRIVTGYRAGVRFERIIKGRGDNVEKLREALSLYFPGESFQTWEQSPAVDALLWFYRCGNDEETSDEEDDDGPVSKYRAFDFRYDSGLVYAAFMQAYRIDLIKNNIHWWQFKALFDALPDDTRLVKTIGYRTAEVPAGATDEQRQRIEDLRRAHALPEDADQKQLKTDLEKILRAGGNPAALLEGGAAYGIGRDP